LKSPTSLVEWGVTSISSNLQAAKLTFCGLMWLHDFAEDHLQKFQDYIEEAPHRIKVGCFAGGAAIVLNGLLSVIDVFDATRPDFFFGGEWGFVYKEK